MAKRTGPSAGTDQPPPAPRLPRDALSKIKLGVSFAEYDMTLKNNPTVFVQTPATMAAKDTERQKYFFVGRRGTGKTATSLHVEAADHHAHQVHPEIFSPTDQTFGATSFADPTQRPYRSLVSAFRRALQTEILGQWVQCCGVRVYRLPASLTPEAQRAINVSFDERLNSYLKELLDALGELNESHWLSLINIPKNLAADMEQCRAAPSNYHTLILDRLDEFWDGSDVAVSYLSALMHAVLQMNAASVAFRALIFVRENVFERVRAIDPEFSRLETSVVGLDWTQPQLIELVERRMNAPFISKLSLGGETWNYFFEDPTYATQLVFDYCQNRPRDVLIYCDFAVESALAHGHQKILIEDVQDARRRFSDSRLKDLGDEYSENYPQISLVLSRFYSLGRRFTLRGLEDLLALLLQDDEIKESCASWIYTVTSPELFSRLLYNIGFLGLQQQKGATSYRSTGPRDTTPPPISKSAHLVVHPSYWDALDLQDKLVTELDESRPYQRVGLIADLPEAMTHMEYSTKLQTLEDQLQVLPSGDANSDEFERVIGEVIRLCFHRVLTNVEPKVRDLNGRVIRDWIASNRADFGFWEMVRQRYGATQVVWECKNYEKLTADDFHQISYYLNDQIGRFGVIVCRGDFSPHYAEHVRRIATEKSGIVLVLGDKDIRVFLRQARNGKVKDGHIQEVYDRIIRLVS